jgi:hypothetical protein
VNGMQPVQGVSGKSSMTRFEPEFDSKHDTAHALAAEQHTHAAYAHWVVHHQLKRGKESSVLEFAKIAHEHSLKAAELSKQALEQEASIREHRCLAAR